MAELTVEAEARATEGARREWQQLARTALTAAGELRRELDKANHRIETLELLVKLRDRELGDMGVWE